LIELNRTLAQLRLSGMATVLETRLLQAQSEAMIPIDMISILVSDELECRNCWSDATNRRSFVKPPNIWTTSTSNSTSR
jgi:hypothetical protein